MQELIGSVLGRYKLAEHLGCSKEGHLFRGVQVGLDRPVAVRVLGPEQLADNRTLSRFRQECRATAALSHAHIMTIYDSGKHQQVRYAVMELLAPGTLGRRVSTEGPLEIEAALQVAEELAEALEYIRERKLIHGNLHPGNIRFDLRGSTILAGFGAEPTELRSLVDAQGTHGYASPELLMGGAVDHRSDLYQLGAVIYEAVTGRLPYPGRPPFVSGGSGYEAAIALPRTLRKEVTAPLEELLMRCLRVAPGERPLDATDLRKQVAKVRRRFSVRAISRKTPTITTGAGADAVPTKSIKRKEVQAEAAMGSTQAVRTGASGDGAGKFIRLLTGGYSDLSKRETQVRLALLGAPILFVLAGALLFATGLLTGQEAKILEQVHVATERSVEVSWRTDVECFGVLEVNRAQEEPRVTPPADEPGRDFRRTLSGLTPDTEYSYRIGTSLRAGGSPHWTATRRFRTEAGLEIREVAVVGRTSSLVDLAWTTTRPTDTRVRYWSSGGARETHENPSQRRALHHSIRVENLRAQTQYRFQILAASPEGNRTEVVSPTGKFTTRASAVSKDPRAGRMDAMVARLRGLGPAALNKLERSLEDVLALKQDLSGEQKVLLGLTQTTDSAGFYRRSRLAQQWLKQLGNAEVALPPVPQWATENSFSGVLTQLQAGYKPEVAHQRNQRLDECLRALAGAEGIDIRG